MSSTTYPIQSFFNTEKEVDEFLSTLQKFNKPSFNKPTTWVWWSYGGSNGKSTLLKQLFPNAFNIGGDGVLVTGNKKIEMMNVDENTTLNVILGNPDFVTCFPKTFKNNSNLRDILTPLFNDTTKIQTLLDDFEKFKKDDSTWWLVSVDTEFSKKILKILFPFDLIDSNGFLSYKGKTIWTPNVIPKFDLFDGRCIVTNLDKNTETNKNNDAVKEKLIPMFNNSAKVDLLLNDFEEFKKGDFTWYLVGVDKKFTEKILEVLFGSVAISYGGRNIHKVSSLPLQLDTNSIVTDFDQNLSPDFVLTFEKLCDNQYDERLKYFSQSFENIKTINEDFSQVPCTLCYKTNVKNYTLFNYKFCNNCYKNCDAKIPKKTVTMSEKEHNDYLEYLKNKK